MLIGYVARLQAFLLHQFHSSWKHEYLTSLKQHHQATGINSQQIKKGNIILAHNDTTRITWKLAVIEELMKERDGLVHATKIRTGQERTNHPIARLVALEVSSDVANSSSTDEANTIPPPDCSDHDTV